MSRVIVCGSINIDIVATVAYQPRLGETVKGDELHYFPGGKGANQAVAAARAGATVTMLGAIGRDPFGCRLKEFLHQSNIDVSNIVECEDIATGTALILVSSDGQNSITVVPGANNKVDTAFVRQADLNQGDILLAQCETPINTTIEFFQRGKNVGAKRVFNPSPMESIPAELLTLTDVLVVNELELSVLTGRVLSNESSDAEVADCLSLLRTKGFDGLAIVTLGARGSLALTNDRIISTAGHHVTPVDTTGAGDSYLGFLAAELSRGTELTSALAVANAAGALCVQQAGAGASIPTREQVTAYLRSCALVSA